MGKKKFALVPVLDFIVHVNRSVKPSYPDWIKEIVYPELESAGPVEYDLQTLQQWLHDDQKGGVITGFILFNHLQRHNVLFSCLNLQDGLAIQQKGIAIFRKLFAGKVIFLWGSVVKNLNDHMFVPYLYERDSTVELDWRRLNHYAPNDPVFHFSK